MPRLYRKRPMKAGLPPGTLVSGAIPRKGKPKITIIDYDENTFEERSVEAVEECFPFKDTNTVTWINIDGVYDIETVEKIGLQFEIHPLVLEDIVSVGQRPKMEDFESYIYLVIKMITFDEKKDDIDAEQVSIVLGPNFVLSFQEHPGDVFDSIRDRLRNKKGRIMKMGPDYLAYSLMDVIVDNYFSILERVGDRVELMDEELVANPEPKTLVEIQKLKREMIFLRKSVWPLREMISGLQRAESKLIKKQTEIYLRDVHDHTIQVIDTIEALRDMISGILDIYMTSVSNKMNEVMKVLTIIATIFIPLTYIAGIYGMNFQYMPELGLRWAYPAVWIVMGTVGLLMILFFKRRKWL
jgi:magnesium transporter